MGFAMPFSPRWSGADPWTALEYRKRPFRCWRRASCPIPPTSPADQVRENVAEEIGGDQDVELPGIQQPVSWRHASMMTVSRVNLALVLSLVQLQAGFPRKCR